MRYASSLRLVPLALLGLSATLVGSPVAHTQDAGDAITTEVRQAHGLYITGPAVRMSGPDGIVAMVHGSRMDTAVIDLKDAAGRVHWDTHIPALEPQETGMLGDVPVLIGALHAAHIRAVARIVCFTDSVLANREPDRAIMDARPRHEDEVWTSWGTGGQWLDPWDARNHDLIVAIAEEAEALGFDEVQFDYIRFPVDDGTPFARYPHERPGMERRDLLLGLLARIDSAIDIPIGVDVFGIQAFWAGDRSGLGQDLALWTAHVEVFTPMLYLNSMTAWELGTEHRARRLVSIGVRRLRTRLGPAPVIRPFLQGFEEGAEDWGPEFIAEQLRGARSGGADGYLFWHPGSSFSMVRRAMIGPARSLSPFGAPPRVRSHGDEDR